MKYVLLLVCFCCFVQNALSQSPYSGSPVSIPGRVESERYDLGGEGIAYHDTEASNFGGQFRADGVDIEQCFEAGCGYAVAYINQNEWLKYAVNVAESGSYNFSFRVASPTGSSAHIEIDGQNVSGNIIVPNTGGFHNWQTVVKLAIPLSAGNHSVRFVADGGSFNFNWFEILTAVNIPPIASMNFPTTFTSVTAPGSITLKANANDPEGNMSRVEFYAGTGLLGSVSAGVNGLYSYSWNPIAGTYNVYVKAYDTSGEVTETTPIQVTSITSGVDTDARYIRVGPSPCILNGASTCTTTVSFSGIGAVLKVTNLVSGAINVYPGSGVETTVSIPGVPVYPGLRLELVSTGKLGTVFKRIYTVAQTLDPPAPAKYRGGSNYFSYDISPWPGPVIPAHNAAPYGVITRYNETVTYQGAKRLVSDIVEEQLHAMRGAGQDSITIPFFFCSHFFCGTDAAERLGINSAPKIDSVTNQQTFIDSIYINNFVNLLKAIKRQGFHRVNIRVNPLREENPNNWSTPNPNPVPQAGAYQDLVSQYLGVARQLTNAVISVKAQTGLPYTIDLGGELLPCPSYSKYTDHIRFLKDIWNGYTSEFGALDNFGFSVIAGDTYYNTVCLKEVVNVYQNGLFPSILHLDTYDVNFSTPPEASKTEQDSYIDIVNSLRDIGWHSMPIMIGENYYNDQIAAQGFAKSIWLTGKPIEYLIQWPLDRTTFPRTNVFVQPNEFINHSLQGF